MSEWRKVTPRAPSRGQKVLATWKETWADGHPHIEACVRDGHWYYVYDGDGPAVDNPPTHFKTLPLEPPQ